MTLVVRRPAPAGGPHEVSISSASYFRTMAKAAEQVCRAVPVFLVNMETTKTNQEVATLTHFVWIGNRDSISKNYTTSVHSFMADRSTKYASTEGK